MLSELVRRIADFNSTLRALHTIRFHYSTVILIILSREYFLDELVLAYRIVPGRFTPLKTKIIVEHIFETVWFIASSNYVNQGCKCASTEGGSYKERPREKRAKLLFVSERLFFYERRSCSLYEPPSVGALMQHCKLRIRFVIWIVFVLKQNIKTISVLGLNDIKNPTKISQPTPHLQL